MEINAVQDRALVRVVVGSIIVNVLTLALFALPGNGDVPGAAKVLAVLCGALALVGAYGLVRRARWGWWITLIVTGFNLLSSVPGIFAWPSTSLGIAIIVSSVAGIAVIVLLFRRDLGRSEWSAHQLVRA
jgi:uncharacterized membrane protein (DUF2068 family)